MIEFFKRPKSPKEEFQSRARQLIEQIKTNLCSLTGEVAGLTEEEKKEQESALRNGSLTLLKMAQRDQEFSSVADDEMLKFSKQLDFPALMLFWESMRQAIEQSGTRVLSERPISILIPPVYLAGMLYYLQGKVPEDSRPKVRDLVDFFLEHSQPNEELRKALKKAKDRI